MNVLVLAGSRGPSDPLAAAAHVRHKTLLPVLGQPMLLRVVRTLDSCRGISRIFISIEDEAALAQIDELRPLLDSGRVRRLATGGTPSLSLALALEAIGLQSPLLVTTGDHPLLTPEMIQAFLDAAPKECDLAVALASGDLVASAYPGAIRTYYRLAGKRYSGCNLFLARSLKAALVARFWQRMEAYRKRPLRLILEVGPVALIGAVLGILSLERAFALLSARVGATIRPVILPFAEAAIDVDKPEDWRLVESILAKRQP